MSQTVAKVAEPTELSDEIRDGLLQDLLAVGLILRDLEQRAPSEDAAHQLASASRAIDEDVRTVRVLIDRLRAA